MPRNLIEDLRRIKKILPAGKLRSANKLALEKELDLEAMQTTLGKLGSALFTYCASKARDEIWRESAPANLKTAFDAAWKYLREEAPAVLDAPDFKKAVNFMIDQKSTSSARDKTADPGYDEVTAAAAGVTYIQLPDGLLPVLSFQANTGENDELVLFKARLTPNDAIFLSQSILEYTADALSDSLRLAEHGMLAFSDNGIAENISEIEVALKKLRANIESILKFKLEGDERSRDDKPRLARR